MDLSVLTAVAPDRDEHLGATQESIIKLRDYFNVQWIVVWDGRATRRLSNADDVIEGRRDSGVACTRNLALPRIASPHVTALDADDLIVVDGALAACEKLAANPSLGWVGLSRTFLDGTPTKHSVSRQLAFAPGELAENWRSPFIFHPNSVVLRSDLLRGIGGWPAVASNEDLAMVLRASEEMMGLLLPRVLTRYRVWDQQEVARVSYVELKRLAFGYIEATLNARRAAIGRTPAKAPANPGGAFGRERVTT